MHCARAWSAWPSSLEGRAAGMSADRMTSALPGRLEEIAIVVAGYLCVRACSQQAWLLGTWRASRFVIIGKKGSCTTQGVCFRAQSVSQSFFASATRLPGPPPSRDRHSDTCGGAVAWRRFPAARGEGWKPTRHTSRPDATAHTYTAHAAHTYVILNAGHNTASAPGFIPRRAK